MRFLRRVSIKRKLMLIIMLTTSITLLLACSAFVAFERTRSRSTLASELTTLATVIGNNCTAAIEFGDHDAAAELLGALEADKRIVAAGVFTREGELLAGYSRDKSHGGLSTLTPGENGHHFESDQFHLMQEIQLQGEVIGSVYMECRLEEMYSTMKRYAGIVIAIMLAATLVAFLLSLRLQKVISEPLLHLAGKAREVSGERNYSVRAVKQSDDEIGTLIDGFNEMLSRIQERDQTISRARSDLEARVEDRTKELVQEIGERTRAEAELRLERDRAQNYLDIAGVLIVALNVHGEITLLNRRGYDVLGYEDGELLGANWFDIALPEQNRGQMRSFFRKLVSEGIARHDYHENDVLAKDGTRKLIAWHNSMLKDDTGRIVGTLSSGEDITDRRKAEETLRLSEARFRKIIEQSNDAIFVRQGRQFVLVNPRFAELLGYTIEDTTAPDFDCMSIVAPESADFISARMQEQDEGHTVPGRYLFKAVSKGLRSLDLEVSETRIDWNDRPAILATVRDITEKTALEEQLRQSQKMEAIGTLAGGVAHDFNNLLAGILGYANVLKCEAEKGTEVYAALTMIEKAAERGADLTRQILGFARKGKEQNVAVDVNVTITEIIGLLRRTIDRNIRLTERLCADSAIVFGDPGQMQQVILNLAINARDAMPDGGEMTFGTELIDLTEEDTRTIVGVSPGRFLLFSIADTGSGIERVVLDRIFEPFFTTKEPGKGTGMGLAMVYGIVKNHGGFIHVFSEPGRGARFKIYLPIASMKARSETWNSTQSLIHGTGKVLLVDDEGTVRKMATRMLAKLGYEVVTAADGQEAVEYFREFWKETDLVILDMIMPRMDGQDCFRVLKTIDPNVKAILSSGYGFTVTAQELIDEGMLGFLPKPYKIGQLSEIVSKALPLQDRPEASVCPPP